MRGFRFSEDFFTVAPRYADERRESYAVLGTPPMWRFKFQPKIFEIVGWKRDRQNCVSRKGAKHVLSVVERAAK